MSSMLHNNIAMIKLDGELVFEFEESPWDEIDSRVGALNLTPHQVKQLIPFKVSFVIKFCVTFVMTPNPKCKVIKS
jgi:hypothetical protein